MQLHKEFLLGNGITNVIVKFPVFTFYQIHPTIEIHGVASVCAFGRHTKEILHRVADYSRTIPRLETKCDGVVENV